VAIAYKLTVPLGDREPTSWEELIGSCRPALSEMIEEAGSANALDMIDAELGMLADESVPSNQAVALIYGDRFFDLLLEELPSDDWQRLFESGETPTASRVLYGVVKNELRKRLKSEALKMIDQLEPRSVGEIGPLSRPSSLTKSS
jgi:hypothetical protein